MSDLENGHLILLGNQFAVNWEKPAVFLDRDGVINVEKHLLNNSAKVELIPRAAEAISELNRSQNPVFIVTNQTVVARGLCDLETVRKINERVLRLLREREAEVVALYCCLHSKQAGVMVYRKDCSWRKPAAGILQAIAAKYQIVLHKSYVIGDQARDVLAGRKVGAKTIVVLTGYGGGDNIYKASADFVKKDLWDAVDSII